MRKMPTPCRQGRASGFTLVEVVLVLLLLSSLALIATFALDNADDQVRFEQTRSRLEQIRHAIIGDTSRTLNGEPVISGFVADMGRLPDNLAELLKKPAPSTPSWSLVTINISGVDLNADLYGGWRGPYLEAQAEKDPEADPPVRSVFRDGWVSPDVSGGDQNFGWRFDLKDKNGVLKADPLLAESLVLQSYGKRRADAERGVADKEDDPPVAELDDPYYADYPQGGSQIQQHDWAIDLAEKPATIVWRGIPGAASNLSLRIYFQRDGVAQSYDSEQFDLAEISPGEMPTSTSVLFPSGEQLLPMGTHVAVILCPDKVTVYAGTCSPGLQPNSVYVVPYYFKLVPRAFTPPLTVNWTVQ